MFAWLRRMVTAPHGLARVRQQSTDPPKRGTQQHLEVYEVSPWPRAVGDKVATAVACTSFRLLSAQRDGKAVRDSRLQKAPYAVRERLIGEAPGTVAEVRDHLFLAALDQPNPFMDRMALLKLTEIHLDFVGDAFWLKDRNGLGAPVGFWPIPPHWITDTPRPDKPTFTVQYRSWNGEIPAAEVVWFHEPAPANPYTRGTGVGWSLGDEIQVDEYAAKMAAAFFFNRARPDFVFATGLDEEETKRLEMEWNNRLQGFWRAHRPYFLHGDSVDLQKQIREFQQPTMEQLVYPNLRKVQRDVILQVWGVAPELFGIVENSNRATIEAAEYLFAKWVVVPKVERLRGALQRVLIADYDERLVLHYDSPVMEDKEHLLNVAKAAPWVPTLDEWRALLKLRPAGDGLGGARYVPLAGYLTADPLDLAQRPKGGGAAAGGEGGSGAGEDKPKALTTTKREERMFGKLVDLVRGLIERPPQPVTLAIKQGDVTVEGAETLVALTPKVQAELPPLPAPVIENNVRAEMPSRLTVAIESVPATETKVTKRSDRGIEETRTEQG